MICCPFETCSSRAPENKPMANPLAQTLIYSISLQCWPLWPSQDLLQHFISSISNKYMPLIGVARRQRGTETIYQRIKFMRNSSRTLLLDQVVNDHTKATMDCNPPLFKTYKSLFNSISPDVSAPVETVECELPLIDLSSLTTTSSEAQAQQCQREIADAAAGWGFFQVVNHGISNELLERMRGVLSEVFRRPFERKSSEKLLDFSADSYRWGTPTATSIRQLSWSEAYHIPLVPPQEHAENHTRHTIEEFAMAMSRLAHKLADILAEQLGCEGTYFMKNCTCNTCYLRLNHYPPCTIQNQVFGLTPHTDSDFLTVLYQDQVGGLQLMKGGTWKTVKPNSDALIINIGDLLQAWSNGIYRSVEHRVMANSHLERFSVAYFLCPSYETMIQSPLEQSIYKKFTFGDYRKQVLEDVKFTGTKIGLTKFLV